MQHMSTKKSVLNTGWILKLQSELWILLVEVHDLLKNSSNSTYDSEEGSFRSEPQSLIFRALLLSLYPKAIGLQATQNLS